MVTTTSFERRTSLKKSSDERKRSENNLDGRARPHKVTQHNNPFRFPKQSPNIVLIFCLAAELVESDKVSLFKGPILTGKWRSDDVSQTVLMLNGWARTVIGDVMRRPCQFKGFNALGNKSAMGIKCMRYIEHQSQDFCKACLKKIKQIKKQDMDWWRKNGLKSEQTDDEIISKAYESYKKLHHDTHILGHISKQLKKHRQPEITINTTHKIFPKTKNCHIAQGNAELKANVLTLKTDKAGQYTGIAVVRVRSTGKEVSLSVCQPYITVRRANTDQPLNEDAFRQNTEIYTYIFSSKQGKAHYHSKELEKIIALSDGLDRNDVTLKEITVTDWETHFKEETPDEAESIIASFKKGFEEISELFPQDESSPSSDGSIEDILGQLEILTVDSKDDTTNFLTKLGLGYTERTGTTRTTERRRMLVNRLIAAEMN